MSAILKLDFDFDSSRLTNELTILEGKLWLDHYNRRDFEGGWDVLPLRSVGGRTDSIYFVPGNATYSDTSFLEECSYLRQVIEMFQCPRRAARLMRLRPGSVIKEHRDDGLGFFDGRIRLHIPVVTNPDVDFILNGARVVMNPGECWYLDFSLPHSVANRGSTDRVHLVLDLLRNDWIERVFDRCGFDREQNVERERDKNIIPDNIELVIAALRKQDSPIVEELIRNLRADLSGDENTSLPPDRDD